MVNNIEPTMIQTSNLNKIYQNIERNYLHKNDGSEVRNYQAITYGLQSLLYNIQNLNDESQVLQLIDIFMITNFRKLNKGKKQEIKNKIITFYNQTKGKTIQLNNKNMVLNNSSNVSLNNISLNLNQNKNEKINNNINKLTKYYESDTLLKNMISNISYQIRMEVLNELQKILPRLQGSKDINYELPLVQKINNYINKTIKKIMVKIYKIKTNLIDRFLNEYNYLQNQNSKKTSYDHYRKLIFDSIDQNIHGEIIKLQNSINSKISSTEKRLPSNIDIKLQLFVREQFNLYLHMMINNLESYSYKKCFEIPVENKPMFRKPLGGIALPGLQKALQKKEECVQISLIKKKMLPKKYVSPSRGAGKNKKRITKKSTKSKKAKKVSKK